MKSFLNIFFVTLGIIFFIVILVGIYFYITDPLNLKPVIFGTETSESGDGVDKNPLLNESQEQTLEAFGIDPADVPSEITAEQEACFEAELGAERVEEIKAGDSPTAAEYLQTKDCM